MTPSAKDTIPVAAAGEGVVPEKLLNEGEVVILALKPSPWFLVLYSWQAVVVAMFVAIAAFVADRGFHVDMRLKLILLMCTAMVVAQLFVACCQWVGRLYVLTNVRVLRVRGVLKVDLFQCPLKSIQNTILTATVPERMLAVGSLYFQAEDCHVPEPGWMHISRPDEVHQIVKEAIQRAKV